jgi:glycosyltransferase involved in cell wall biosynthesis
MLEKINIAINLSKEKRNTLGEIARQHIQNKFSKKIMLNNYYKLYKKVVL